MLEKAAGYRNEIVKLKVQNYSDELNAFNNMLDESLLIKIGGSFTRTNDSLLEKFGQSTDLVSLAASGRMGTGQQLPERDDDLWKCYQSELAGRSLDG